LGPSQVRMGSIRTAQVPFSLFFELGLVVVSGFGYPPPPQASFFFFSRGLARVASFLWAAASAHAGAFASFAFFAVSCPPNHVLAVSLLLSCRLFFEINGTGPAALSNPPPPLAVIPWQTCPSSFDYFIGYQEAGCFGRSFFFFFSCPHQENCPFSSRCVRDLAENTVTGHFFRLPPWIS